MTDTIAPSTIEGDDSNSELSTANPSSRRRFSAAIVLVLVFLVLLTLSLWLYPRRAVVNRPPPFTLNMWAALSHMGNDFNAMGIVPLKIDPNAADSAPSDVHVMVASAGHDLYKVHVAWTYTPALCVDGQTEGCGAVAAPNNVAESALTVSLPAGAKMVRCNECLKAEDWLQGLPTFVERDSTIQPNYPPATDVFPTQPGATPPAKTATAAWEFEVHDTSFAWSANGLNAEASLPIVNFQDDGNVGYGNVTVTYRIPGGSTYDWNDGPDADHLTWTEPVSSASTAVQVAGINNSASASDTRNVLIVGILLGAAGGALVGAIQEFAHAESDERGSKRRR